MRDRLFRRWPWWIVSIAASWTLQPDGTRRHRIGTVLLRRYQADLERRDAALAPARELRFAKLFAAAREARVTKVLRTMARRADPRRSRLN